MTTVSYSVSEVILASRARFNSLTESFSRGHDPISEVRRDRFLTDVGGPLLSVSCRVPLLLGGVLVVLTPGLRKSLLLLRLLSVAFVLL